jgi:asparagine synthase (glutamine-hydrolysing)
MCGIAGIVARDLAPRPEIADMLSAIRHRGPDDEDILTDGHVSLGHRRLSIIDLAGGRQPISNHDNSMHIVCNGEIYNWAELRTSLERSGYRFKTNSDTEVILHLYEEHGTDCLKYLRGMFAFAIWDGRRKTLFAARDHLGQKPLFYSFLDGDFLFASEIKGLTAVRPELRSMSPEAMDQYLAVRIICPPKTMFTGIAKLPPAHFLLQEPGKAPRIERYWDLDFSSKTTAGEAELLDELDALVTDSLRHHMVSDVTVGAFLSGGFDSSLIVAMLCKNLQVKDLPTFTLGLPHARFNEASDAKILADAYGTDHHELTVLPSMAEHLAGLVFHLDEPSDPLSLCTWLISRFARKTVKVTLGGDGGDELFAGYDRYYGNVYAGYYALVPRVVRQHVVRPVLDQLPDGNWYKSHAHQAKWLQELSFLEGGSRYARSLSYFYFTPERRDSLYSDAMRERLQPQDPEQDIRDYYNGASSTEPVDRMLYADYRSRLPDHPALISDRMSMAFGLETRSPFMDHKLVEFCARLPVRMKIRGRRLRYLQTKLAARYLPAPLLTKSKQGFSSALPYLLKDEYKKITGHLLKNSRLIDTGVLEPEPIRGLLTSHMSGRADHGNRLWLLANLEAWHRIHIDRQSVEDFTAELRGAVALPAADLERAHPEPVGSV